MNRLLLVFLLSIASTHCMFGQTYSLEWGGGEYFEVKSYNGEFSPSDFIILQLGSNKMKEAQWMISATIKNVTSKYNGDFPVNMLNLRCVSKSGSSNVPAGNINNMLVWNNLQGLNNEVELINFQSLDQDGYHQLRLNLELQVLGGSYLRHIPRWTTFYFAIEYKLYTRNNNSQSWKLERSLGTSSHFAINIDHDQQDPICSITVLPEVMLEYNSINGYMNGITKTYEKGLKVSATDGYEVRFKSLSNQFTSETTSQTLPLDLVSLQLSGGSGVQQPVTISTSNELILQGATTEGNIVEFDMIYEAKAIEDRFLYINEEQNFSTQLMFEITTR